jgi:hypothetical protein
MADFQAKICEKFNMKSLTDNQSKSEDVLELGP